MSVTVGPLECSADAAVVLALAGTAVGFADGPAEEVERWLRALESAGDAREALTRARAVAAGSPDAAVAVAPAAVASLDDRSGQDRLDAVMEAAGEAAEERGSAAFGTADLLHACLAVYGPAMERALVAGGAPPELVLESHADSGS